MSKAITLAITGASGAPYTLSLMKQLVLAGCEVHILMSSAARVVFATEEDLKVPAKPESATAYFTKLTQAKPNQLKVYGKEEWFSIVASGSSAPKQMVVCPCSTGSLSAIAMGACDNLIERGADVVIKERGQLILVPREMPFSSIHLENMLKLSNMGVTIMPAAPGFYHNPKTIQDLVDFVVARILNHLDIPQTLVEPWGYQLPKGE
jgi:4-hydroxy-3-polyprenylbenzoate decarboxylase